YVALKLLSSSFRKTRDMQERFLREARAAGAIQHANIVTVYDLGESEGQLFIAMELVEGRDLSDMIALREPLALERKLDITIEVLAGLHFAHQRGVIHRDVKPSNVRVMPDGRIKIMDFGIARLQKADSTGSGAIVGTPTYMAPEQITNGAITPATDVFSVGCMLYELLCYQRPFEAESVHGVLYQVLTTEPRPLRTVAPSIPAALERVAAKAMNKVPHERYESAVAGRDRAIVGGVQKLTVPALLRAETGFQAWEQALQRGDESLALGGYVEAAQRHGRARDEARAMDREAQHMIDRVTRVVQAIPTGPAAANAGVFLARAESLLRQQDFTLAKVAAQSAEQIGID